MDEIRISPAGDGFYAAATRRTEPAHQERGCPACYEGVVYLGELVEGEDGEEVEQIEGVACCRCQ